MAGEERTAGEVISAVAVRRFRCRRRALRRPPRLKFSHPGWGCRGCGSWAAASRHRTPA
jgi:hypothetical protein